MDLNREYWDESTDMHATSSLGGMFDFGRAGSQVENLEREGGPGMDHQVGRR
jgi:hypothetical protein